jgi:SAM-dependent methyltransferase
MTGNSTRPAIDAYDSRAEELSDAYESVPFEKVHEGILDLLPAAPGRILDVGAGSGRDAAWFAYRGHEVVAVEPSQEMRREARERHLDPRIRWLADDMPALKETHRTGLSFDFILLSAVWMHVAPEERRRAFRKLVTLLQPRGRLAISLRLGRPDESRSMHPVSREEVERLAHDFGLRVVRCVPAADLLGRGDVRWETVVFEYPDDETGALPLLRHIVLRDDKSSTYKLALLRCIARIADSASGMAREEPDGSISLPLGLVALFWIRMMKPLVEADHPQTPTSRGGEGLGFVREAFGRLRPIAPFDLRPGMRFSGETVGYLIAAFRDVASTICRMPAHYITYPGRDEPVFRTTRRSMRIPDGLLALDEPLLRSFGDFLVPSNVWRTLARLNVWIEPVLVGEWISLMQQYSAKQDRRLAHDTLARALVWLDPERDTRLARERAFELINLGEPLSCVWSGRPLKAAGMDIDHCFPFVAWPCSDLWNLLPASRQMNQQKKDKLVTASRLAGARELVLDWWERAWTGVNRPLRPRFLDEARASLPLPTTAEALGLEEVFEGVQVRRALIRQDQRLPEW